MREKAEIAEEARKQSKTVHFGRLMALCHLKHSENEKVKEEVLSRAKNSLIGKYSLGRQSYSSRSQSTALNVLYGLGDDYDEKCLQRIKEVDTSDLLECAKKYFDVDHKVIVKIIPEVN